VRSEIRIKHSLFSTGHTLQALVLSGRFRNQPSPLALAFGVSV
jgi:hypothetical protein